MKIFIDYIGHLDLDHSFHLLLEKRLGWDIYRPDSGSSWVESGLLLGSYVSPENKQFMDTERNHNITFTEFKETKFDLFIVTCWNNEDIFLDKLIKPWHPDTPVIRHIANSLEEKYRCNNILRSTNIPLPDETNWIQYIPEHRKEYKQVPPTPNNIIKSFFPFMVTYEQELKLWRTCAEILPDFTFKMHGGESQLGVIDHAKMPEEIQSSMFVWHTNPNGCFGYIPRPALACGKPLITNLQHYRNFHTMGSELLSDGVDCIDVHGKTPPEVAEIITEWSHPEVYAEKSSKVAERFREQVNFEQEAAKIKQWMEGLL